MTCIFLVRILNYKPCQTSLKDRHLRLNKATHYAHYHGLNNLDCSKEFYFSTFVLKTRWTRQLLTREWMMNHGSGEPSTSLSWLLDIDDQLMDKISNGILC